jgi:peptidoglycan biosynthesis protein MviN/MurJ (putative lipid II flippase)
LNSLLKRLGSYQLTLAISRGLGLLRDILIVYFIGASLLSDHIFFLLTFSDVLMTLLIGGGVNLYIAEQLKYRDVSQSSVIISSLLFFSLFSLILVTLENMFSAPVGSLLFVRLDRHAELASAYSISFYILLLSMPVAVFNGYFLFKDSLHYQPLTNVFFSLVTLSGLLFFFLFELNQLSYIAGLLLLAGMVRLMFAFFISRYKLQLRFSNVRLISDIKFYKQLFYSGLSVGIVFFLPYLFRGRLPEFGDGFYTLSALVFKFNDLFIAFLLIPVVTFCLRDKKNCSSSDYLSGLLRLFVVSVLLVLMMTGLAYLISEYVGFETDDMVIMLLSLCLLIFVGAAFYSTMYFVKIKSSSFSSGLGLVGLFVFLAFRNLFVDIFYYFYFFYLLLFLFTLFHGLKLYLNDRYFIK